MGLFIETTGGQRNRLFAYRPHLDLLQADEV